MGTTLSRSDLPLQRTRERKGDAKVLKTYVDSSILHHNSPPREKGINDQIISGPCRFQLEAGHGASTACQTRLRGNVPRAAENTQLPSVCRGLFDSVWVLISIKGTPEPPA